MNTLNPFHLAIPVNNLKESQLFYKNILGCKEGRSSNEWIDFNFFGHQLVIHEISKKNIIESNLIDNYNVPIPHFGVVLKWNHWLDLSNKLKTENIEFIIEPYIRFEGKKGEQGTLFFIDPSGNALEFKAFKNINQLFER